MARNPSNKIQRGPVITLTIDDREVSAYAGETIATILLAQGISRFNQTLKGQPRGPYCNMGTCFECQVQWVDAAMVEAIVDTHKKVVVDDVVDTHSFRWVRACMLPARQGMIVLTGATLLSDPGEKRGDLANNVAARANDEANCEADGAKAESAETDGSDHAD